MYTYLSDKSLDIGPESLFRDALHYLHQTSILHLLVMSRKSQGCTKAAEGVSSEHYSPGNISNPVSESSSNPVEAIDRTSDMHKGIRLTGA